MRKLSDNAARIVDLRYSRKDADGNPTETWPQIIDRVAKNVAVVTGIYGDAPIVEGITPIDLDVFPYRTAVRQWHYGLITPDWQSEDQILAQRLSLKAGEILAQAEKYKTLLADGLFMPNSPTFTGAGTPLGQLSACFVLPIHDDLQSIFETLKQAVMIQRTGGGNGFSGALVRPADALVTRSMGRASGPVGFLEAYNACFQIIAQGGSRRGANMFVLPVWHPDVLRFIRAKVDEGKIEGFNISVAITDTFMEAVDKNVDWHLGFDGKAYNTVAARDLFDEIAADAWRIGDPGLLFIDRANRDNPCPHHYEYLATNPCGEQWLPDYGSCNLGSIALQRFVRHGQNDPAPFLHWEGLAEAIHTAVEFLDDVVDANQYVAEVPELERMAQNERRIGLGYMGLADAMALLGIRYGSEEGIAFAGHVTEFLRYHAMAASIERARERGRFPWFAGSVYDQEVNWSRPVGLVPQPYHFGRNDLDWSLITEGLRDHGIRNACQITMAPTGTISNVADCDGSGMECFFALAYERTVMQEGQDIKLIVRNWTLEAVLRGRGWNEDQIERVFSYIVALGGSCQEVADIPSDIRYAFPVAADLNVREHVLMQASVQAWVDNSVSKTINLANDATVVDVAEAYRLAYHAGCKGITVYRQGSRNVEVLSTQPIPETVTAETWPVLRPLAIPASAAVEGLPARVFPVETAFGKVQTTITQLPDHPDRPFDARLQVGKAGNDKAADVEALGRLVSLVLRLGGSVADVVDQLEGIGGRTFNGFGPNKTLSVADGVGKLLRRLYLSPEDPGTSEGLTEASPGTLNLLAVCPQCHLTSLVLSAGCETCTNPQCSYTRCQ